MKNPEQLTDTELLLGENFLFSDKTIDVRSNEARTQALVHAGKLISEYGKILELLPIHQGEQFATIKVDAFINKTTNLAETITNFELIDNSDFKARLAANPIETLPEVRDNITAWSTQTLANFCRDLENKTASESEKEDLLGHYQKLKSYLRLSGESSGIDPAYSVLGFLHKGLLSGTFTAFDIVRTAPIEFYRSENRIIDSVDLEEVVMNSYPLLYLLSSMQLRKFVSLKAYSDIAFPSSIQSQKKLKFEFQNEIFEFDRVKKALKLKKEFLIEWRQLIEEGSIMHTKRIGCPARKTSSDGKNSIFNTLLRSHLKNFVRYVGPHLENYSTAWTSRSDSG